MINKGKGNKFQHSINKTCCSSEDKFITEDAMARTWLFIWTWMCFCSGVVVTWSWWCREWIHAQSEGQGCRNKDRLRIELSLVKNLNDTKPFLYYKHQVLGHYHDIFDRDSNLKICLQTELVAQKVENHWFNESEVKRQLTVPTVKNYDR